MVAGCPLSSFPFEMASRPQSYASRVQHLQANRSRLDSVFRKTVARLTCGMSCRYFDYSEGNQR